MIHKLGVIISWTLRRMIDVLTIYIYFINMFDFGVKTKHTSVPPIEVFEDL